MERPCAGHEACVAGRCEPAAEPQPRGIAERGLLNGWSVQVGVPVKVRDEVAASGSLGTLASGSGARAVCAADGYVNPVQRRAEPKDRASTAAVLSGRLISDRARTLELAAGVMGKLTLHVAGRRIELDELPGREGRPWMDERFATVELPKGVSPVVAVLEPDSGGFFLRVRDSEGRTPNGLGFVEGLANARCPDDALLSLDARLEARPAGLFASARPQFLGLVPRLPSQPVLAVRTESRGAMSSDHEISLARGALVRGEPDLVAQAIGVADKGSTQITVGSTARPGLARTLPEDRGLLARISALLALSRKVSSRAALPEGSRASFEHQVQLVAEAYAQGDSDRAWLRRKIDEAEELGRALDANEDPYAKKRGVVARAYRSPLDGALQRYVAYVPPSIDKGQPLPLVLVAHGRDRLPEHALRTLIGQAPDEHMTLRFAERNLPAFPDQGALLAAPWGYGNAGVLPLGEQDLSSVIAELSRAYRVDPTRVTLTGYSLGGTVSFAAPLHTPDRFAAAAPLCGYPNLLDYNSVAKVDKLPWEKVMLEKEYIVRYADNGAHVPLHIVHGGKDVPGRSKVVADRYKALRYSHVFDIQEDLDHNVWDYAYEDGKMVSWLKRHRIPSAPKSVTFQTGKLRYDRAYWLRVLGQIDGASGKPARVEGALDPGGISLTTENVSALAIDAARAGFGADADVRLRIDGATLSAKGGATISLRRGDKGQFEIGAPPQGHKTFGSSGPIDDVQNGPVTVVYGTRRPALREANRMLAEHWSKLGGAAEVSYPVLSDQAADEASLAGRHVVLVGGPLDNSLTARVASLLPVSFEPDAITLRGQRVAGQHVGVALIFPGPDLFFGADPVRRGSQRYVVLLAGLSARATLSARMLPRYLPDFVVFDEPSMKQRGGLLMDQRKPLLAGFFSESWQ